LRNIICKWSTGQDDIFGKLIIDSKEADYKDLENSIKQNDSLTLTLVNDQMEYKELDGLDSAGMRFDNIIKHQTISEMDRRIHMLKDLGLIQCRESYFEEARLTSTQFQLKIGGFMKLAIASCSGMFSEIFVDSIAKLGDSLDFAICAKEKESKLNYQKTTVNLIEGKTIGVLTIHVIKHNYDINIGSGMFSASSEDYETGFLMGVCVLRDPYWNSDEYIDFIYKRMINFDKFKIRNPSPKEIEARKIQLIKTLYKDFKKHVKELDNLLENDSDEIENEDDNKDK